MSEKETAKIMWAVFQWAYKNWITVEMHRRRDYSAEDGYPVLRFSRGNNHIERAFYPLVDMGPEMKHTWREIAIELCVEPLVLP